MTRRKIKDHSREEHVELPIRQQHDRDLVHAQALLGRYHTNSDETTSTSTLQHELEEPEPKPDDVQLIHTHLLIPGKGPPTLDSNVVVKDGKIAFVGPSHSLPEKYARLLPTYVPVLMPGMWDCHTVSAVFPIDLCRELVLYQTRL